MYLAGRNDLLCYIFNNPYFFDLFFENFIKNGQIIFVKMHNEHLVFLCCYTKFMVWIIDKLGALMYN